MGADKCQSRIGMLKTWNLDSGTNICHISDWNLVDTAGNSGKNYPTREEHFAQFITICAQALGGTPYPCLARSETISTKKKLKRKLRV